MRTVGVLVFLFISFAGLPLPEAQDWVSHHREDESKWATKTGVPALAIHRMWRALSHFSDEQDDDSHIELLDTTSFAARNQILLITSAGQPRCLALAVFSKATGFLKIWSEEKAPDGHGFCDNLGIAVRCEVRERYIEVIVPGEPISPNASHANIIHYNYHWSGKTYLAAEKWQSLEFIPR